MCKEYLPITKDIDRAKKHFENILAYEISPHTLDEIIKSQSGEINTFNFVDVRTYEDYIEGHIPFAQHLPFDTLEDNLKILDKSKPTVVYCYNIVCHLAKHAIMKLLKHGYACKELAGGFEKWKHFDYDVVRTDSII